MRSGQGHDDPPGRGVQSRPAAQPPALARLREAAVEPRDVSGRREGLQWQREAIEPSTVQEHGDHSVATSVVVDGLETNIAAVASADPGLGYTVRRFWGPKPRHASSPITRGLNT